MIGRAMSIGMAKPMPVESRSTAVLMPMTAPAASRSGPPLLPGLIAASVWIRFVSWSSAVIWTVRPVAEMIPVVTVLGVRPERRADRDRELADPDVRRLADRRGRQAGDVDLDDREVGQRVDAVDRALELAAVLELDRQPSGDRAVPVSTTWRLVRIQPAAS